MITIYAFIFPGGKVRLSFQVLEEVNALEINEVVPNLKILYGNEDILSSKRNLRVLDVRVVNSGNVDILKSFFDPLVPFGLVVLSAEVLQTPSVIDASNEYLKHNIRLTLLSGNQILLDPIIIHRGEYFTIRIITLHSAGTSPTIESVGKVAGSGDPSFG